MVFFAISGYVIPNSLRGARLAGAKHFIIRRFWRLYPPFWVVLAWACIAKFSNLWDKNFLWGLTMLPSAVGVDNALGHFWTLEVELLFYSLLLVLFLLSGRSGVSALGGGIYLLSIGLSSYFSFPPMGNSLWLRLPLFFSVMFWGACCREIMRFDFSEWRLLRLSGHLMRVVLIGVITGLLLMSPIINVYYGFIDGDVVSMRQFSPVIISVLVFLFWVILRPVQIRWLARCGRWTYSVYLWHMMPIHATVISVQSGVIEGIGGWPLPLYIIVFLPISFALGAAAYRWIEQPSDRIGKRIAG